MESGLNVPFCTISFGNRLGSFLIETLACPGQGSSSETASGQPGTENFAVLVEKTDQMIELGNTVFKKFRRTLVGFLEQAAKLFRTFRFTEACLELLNSCLFSDNVPGSFENIFLKVCSLEQFVRTVGQVVKLGVECLQGAQGVHAFPVSGAIVGIHQIMLDSRVENPECGPFGKGQGGEGFFGAINAHDLVFFAKGGSALVQNSTGQSDPFVFRFPAYRNQFAFRQFPAPKLEQAKGSGQFHRST